ncbi:uncharacterized protein LOC101735330 isoform X2 [Bombyx mori]|nr:uncharacterized protein LOC101735330 isoform X2 [Bombyx mori]
MFECKCDFSDYRTTECLPNDCQELIPGLINFNNEINLKLAKEEKKFKQTVVMAGEKSIVLKARKRNCKITKKYAEYHANMKRFKRDPEAGPEIIVVAHKLNCTNIEPWCMVHNLYKCFCKGRFTTNLQCLDGDEKFVNKSFPSKSEALNNDQSLKQLIKIDDIDKIHTNYLKNKKRDEQPEILDSFELNELSTCARINPYQGRNHDENYYKEVQGKIINMEKNDRQLAKRMIKLQNISENKEHDDCSVIEPEDKNIKFEIIDDNYENDLGELKDINEVNSSEPLNLVEIINNLWNKNKGPNYIRSAKYKKNLVRWFESSYKLYKNKVKEGFKICLEAPRIGKLALHPWEFILSRYRERKNFFMVSKTEPFRIFLSVNLKNPFFNDCINIDKIRFVDLQKYPLTIKNLLTNATDLEENYCILYGFSDWWELIGTVSKIRSKGEKTIDNQTSSLKSPKPRFSSGDETSNFAKSDEDSDTWSYLVPDDDEDTDQMVLSNEPGALISEPKSSLKQSMSESTTSSTITINANQENVPSKNCSTFNKNKEGCSKWFMMTVENDFSEIRFNNGGFFVTYDKIVKAINVARISGKAVRLSSQKCAPKNSGPQYGLYAIPDSNEYCVFIGPYEPNESLGIQTIKTILHLRKQNKTRGIWITTDKIDNHKLIHNPMSFIPNLKDGCSEMLPLQNYSSSHSTEPIDIKKTGRIKVTVLDKKTLSDTELSPEKNTKKLPTINIKRTNDFYHIGSNGNIKTVTNWNPHLLVDNNKPTASSVSSESSIENNDSSNNTPISQKSDSHPKTLSSTVPAFKFPQRGMFVLKPEQINNKLLLSNTLSKVLNKNPEVYEEIKNIKDDIKPLDINMSEDVLIISDDDDDDGDSKSLINDPENDCEKITEVWIQCSNVLNFGWIKGTRNSENLISLQFPGFYPTSYYQESEVFTKINGVLCGIIQVPKNFVFEWQVLESENELDSEPLEISNFKSTKNIIRKSIKNKFEVIKSQELLGESSNNSQITLNDFSSSANLNTSKEMSDFINDLEIKSQMLENEGTTMWNATMMKKEEILSSLTDTNLTESLTEKLKVIKSMAEDE